MRHLHLHLDLETRATADLPAVGLHNYARDKHTDIWCACFAFNDEEPRTWVPGEKVPQDVYDHIESGGQVWAHNASFEREIINCVGTRKYGWPYLYTEQLVCTMAMAYAMALPGTLERAAAALGVDMQKDMEGSRVMKQLMKPREILPNGNPVWWDIPEKVTRLIEYCKQDVRTERAIGKRMVPLSKYERDLWILDQKINDRGIRVDVNAASAAHKIVEAEKDFLNEEIRKISGGEIATCSAVAQIKKFLIRRGVIEIDSIDKANIIEILQRENVPEVCKQVLHLRSRANKASNAKLLAMVTSASQMDDRTRGNYQYSGANTRRWAARRIQLHNLKRPTLKHETIEMIIDQLRTGKLDRETFNLVYGDPLDVISDLIRGMLLAEDGKELVAGDFSAVESRVTAWFANHTAKLKLFEEGIDNYVDAAASVFGLKRELISKIQRSVGKVAELALGFGGGVGAFQTMAKGYNVTMAPAFESLWSRATDDQKRQVEASFQKNKTKYEISREEFIASDLTKMFWREANPQIVDLWRDVETAAIAAVNQPGAIVKTNVGNIAYKLSGSFLFCRLPSNGVIVYPYPQIKEVKTPWGAKKQALTYMSENGMTKQWERFTTYGGSLVENCVQSFSRDLLADSMIRVEKAGMPICLHTHDEIVCEIQKGKGSLQDLEKIMSEVPVWAKGLPLSAEGWIGTRYRK